MEKQVMLAMQVFGKFEMYLYKSLLSGSFMSRCWAITKVPHVFKCLRNLIYTNVNYIRYNDL